MSAMIQILTKAALIILSLVALLTTIATNRRLSALHNQQSTPSTATTTSITMTVDCITLTKKYFEVWNAHDVSGIQGLHAATSTLADWDGSHGPTNEEVASGIGGIWKAVPEVQIEIVDIYTMGDKSNTCVANIMVIVDASTTLKVCDVIEYDESGLVVALNAYKTD
mmetsp:Transcript_21909/g.34430  ORF Transcript_21909/g.34430 Transcript_21909/m.34430 type:complete len:167 (-) Transcript_21909:382-882(-)